MTQPNTALKELQNSKEGECVKPPYNLTELTIVPVVEKMQLYLKMFHMIEPKMQAGLMQAIDNAYNQFIDRLNHLPDQLVNTVPWKDGWTAGQVADHILKATGGIPDNQTKPADRPVDQLIGDVEAAFLNFDIRMQSPEFILPANGTFEKEELIPALENIKNDHLQTIKDKDLSAICMDFELPYTGHFTRYEWLRFFVAHCKRHTKQLERIADALASRKEKVE